MIRLTVFYGWKYLLKFGINCHYHKKNWLLILTEFMVDTSDVDYIRKLLLSKISY